MLKKSVTRKKKTKYEYRGRNKYILLIAVIILSAFVILHGGEKDNGLRTVGYLPSWYYQCFDDIDLSCLTDINIAFVNPDSNGNLSVGIPDEQLRKIVKKAHRNDVRVLIALGGGNGTANYTELTADSNSRKAFNKKIIKYVQEYDFDGIDLNIEGEVNPAFWDTYGDWVKGLRKKCDRKDLVLTCACATWFDKNISSETLEMFDYVSIMAYDNKGAHNHSSYDYAENQLSYFSNDKGIDKDKLLLGVPFYGYRYSNGICTGKAVTYKEIATYNKDSQYVDESGTCRYNGIDTMKAKAKLSKEYGGVMVWCLGQDTDNKYSLLRAINEALTEKE